MYKEEKIRRERKQIISRGLYDSNLNQDKYLKTLNNARNFSYDKFNKGKEWYENGFSLEQADISLRNDISFVKGYSHGIRLSLINEKENNVKKR